MDIVAIIKKYINFESIFKFFLIILPFHVIISVFLQYKLGIPGAGLYKEFLIFVLGALLVYEFYKIRRKPEFEKLDYLIFGYFGYLILISLIKFYSIKAIIYGGRYDFEFLLIFLIVRHGSFLLKEKLSYYIRLFLISAGIAIVVGLIVRFVTGEGILVYFGFSPHLSTWSITEGPAIYSGVEGANVRRFQGIFDGPNQAAFFLVVFSGILFHYMKNKKDQHFYLYLILFINFGLVFLTYTRSALLGIVLSLFLVFILNIKLFLKKFLKESIFVLVLISILGSIFYVRYGGSIGEIVGRASSTKGHSERMIIGFKQFLSEPLGRGLSSSGPGYRLVRDTNGIDEKNFIPESWYIQQLVEGGIIGFVLFIAIMGIIAISIYSMSMAVFFSFMAVLAMNLLLHTFEASYISILLFMILGLFLKKKYKNNSKK